MSATTPDVPLHPRTDRWVFRSGGESGRVSRAERRGEHRGHEARRACADASEKPDRPWHRTTSSSRIITLRRSEEHTSELQSHSDLVCRLLLEKKKKKKKKIIKLQTTQ